MQRTMIFVSMRSPVRVFHTWVHEPRRHQLLVELGIHGGVRRKAHARAVLNDGRGRGSRKPVGSSN